MLKGFRDFISQGNVVDLAVAVIIGNAFKPIVDKVTAFIMGILAQLIGSPNFDSVLQFKIDPSSKEYIQPGAILTLMLPVLLPIANGLGLDLVHFGVMVVLNLMIGQVTPPFGVCLFVISDVNKLKLERLYRSILPFLVPLILTLILVTYIPGIVTALPNALLS